MIQQYIVYTNLLGFWPFYVLMQEAMFKFSMIMTIFVEINLFYNLSVAAGNYQSFQRVLAII